MKSLKLLFATAFLLPNVVQAQANPPLRVAIVGIVHGQVLCFLHNLPSHPEVTVVGILDAGRRSAQTGRAVHVAHAAAK